jgi:hypothetical protein
MSAVNKIRQNHSWYVDSMSHRSLLIFFSDQIKRHAKESQKHTYTLLLVPRISTLVSRILEEEGVLGDVIISSYNLQFIPLAEDVISLENDSAFKDIWVVSEPFFLLNTGL